jgi:putative tributyrin esterase
MAQLTCNFFSYTLHRAVDVSIILPTPVFSDAMGEGKAPTHHPKAKYPVLYLLHGYGNDSSTWRRYTPLERYAEEANIAVVTFAGENKAYANHPGDDKFYDFIAKELPDFVLGLFPISDRREDTYIAGLSMGGYGTLLHALSRPGDFCAFGAFSAGLGEEGSQMAADAVVGEQRPDISYLLKEAAGNMDKLPKGYLSCGTEDFLYKVNLKFQEQYLAQGGDLLWKAVPGFGHEWPFWDQEIKAFLDWIPRTDAYVGEKRRV